MPDRARTTLVVGAAGAVLAAWLVALALLALWVIGVL
jgi:hypothetical protein